jgi:hypothetical protein
MAMAASPLQHNVADQGDIIVKLNRVLTMRAVRTRPDNGLFFGQSKDTNIQETTDECPEYNGNNVPHRNLMPMKKEC